MIGWRWRGAGRCRMWGGLSAADAGDQGGELLADLAHPGAEQQDQRAAKPLVLSRNRPQQGFQDEEEAVEGGRGKRLRHERNENIFEGIWASVNVGKTSISRSIAPLTPTLARFATQGLRAPELAQGEIGARPGR